MTRVLVEVLPWVTSPVGVWNTFPTLVFPLSAVNTEGSWAPRWCLIGCGRQAGSPAVVKQVASMGHGSESSLNRGR